MRRTGSSIALAAAVATLAGSIALAVGYLHHSSYATGTAMMSGYRTGGTGAGYGAANGAGMTGGGGMTGGAGMMNGAGTTMASLWLAGDGTRITSIAAARTRAATAARTSGLHPGEVLWFDNGAAGATTLLVVALLVAP